MKKRFLFLVFNFVILFSLNLCMAEAAETMGFSAEDFCADFSTLFHDIAGDAAEDDFTEKDDLLNQQRIIKLNEDVSVKLPYMKADGVSQVKSVNVVYDESSNEESESVFIYAMSSAIYEISNLKNIELPEDFSQLLSDIISTGKQKFGDGFIYFSRSGDEGSYHYEMNVTMEDAEVTVSEDASDTSDTSDAPAYDIEASEEFDDFVAELISQSLIPAEGRKNYFHEDYEDSWAQINWYQWNPFTTAKNFVIAAEISWESAAERPNTFSSGCGFVFRDNGDHYKRSMLAASIRMDGRVYLRGERNNYDLNYHNYYYGNAATRATHQFALLANGDNVRIYVDGYEIANYVGVAIMDEGNIAFATMSGTNTGFGTRCEFKNIFYTTW